MLMPRLVTGHEHVEPNAILGEQKIARAWSVF